VSDFLERALAKDKERRFQTASEMRAALSRLRTLEGATARPAAGLASGVGLQGPRAASAGMGSRPSSSTSGARSPLASRPGPGTASGSGPGSTLRRSATARVRPRRPLWPWLAGGGALLVAVAAALSLWLVKRAEAPPPGASAEVKALTQTLVERQLQLASRELEGKNYAEAVRHAESVLRLAPGQPQADTVLAESRKRQKELDRVATGLRQQIERGDTAAAARQFSRLVELDPRHPAAEKASPRLGKAFREKVAAAAAAAHESERSASETGVRSGSEFALATAQLEAARAAAARDEFAEATRLFLVARDGFTRARLAGAESKPAQGGWRPW
jgi:hypothetical protein